MDEARKKKRRRAASNGADAHVPPLILKGDEHPETHDAAENGTDAVGRGVT